MATAFGGTLWRFAGPALALAAAGASAFGFAACSSSSSNATPAEDAGPTEDAGDPRNVCPPNGISKGPWALAMTRTSMKVRWEACRADAKGGLVFKPESSGDFVDAPSTTSTFELKETFEAALNRESPPDFAGTYTMHEATLSSLTPGTCYRYELAGDRTLGGRFCTAQPDGGKVHFMAIADTNPLLGQSTSRVLSKVIPLRPTSSSTRETSSTTTRASRRGRAGSR